MLYQITLALVLAIPTLLVGHIVAFGIANIGGALGPYPAGNFFYAAGEGLMASVYLAILLYRVSLSTAVRVCCWTTALVLWVGVMPAWGVLLHGEAMHLALICILGVTSFFVWLVWLPKWLTPRRRLHLTKTQT